MRFSKQQLRALQEKFGSAYKVLAAEQREAGIVACLADKIGATAIYMMASADEAVYPEKVQSVNAQVHFCAEGCEDVTVDASDVVEEMSAAAKNASAEAETAKAELVKAQETIKQMEAAESARRLSAAKKAATDTLAQFNANREDKVGEDAIKALSADIEAGKFTACEDENHNWTGEQMVAEKVKALCADAVMEQDKASATARANASKATYAWEKLASGVADDGSVEALLARKCITG